MNNIIANIVCPICKGIIVNDGEYIICKNCNTKFLQDSESHINLLVKEDSDDKDWSLRQSKMENWYTELISEPQAAIDCINADYYQYKDLFSNLNGNILDLGGGNGIVRHYLSEDANYIVLEPSITWLSKEWENIKGTFPCLGINVFFIKGQAEYIPFPKNSFDVVMSLWSLNHVSSPKKVISEVYNVLKGGGIFLIILEDMEPTFIDSIKFILNNDNEYYRGQEVLKNKIVNYIRNSKWSIQDDHIRIYESDLNDWIKDRFIISFRKWYKNYLTFSLSKI